MVDQVEVRQGLDALTGVHVRQRVRVFPVVLGLAVLVAAAVVGGGCSSWACAMVP
ncbi:MAG: hypothetical protein R3F60_17395 [bacterium]